MGVSDSTAALCEVCSKLDIQHLTHPLQPCRNPLPCSIPPTRQFGTFFALGTVDEIKSRRSACDVCGIVAETLDKEPAGLTGQCRITESAEFCHFSLPMDVQPRDPSVTHFHLTQASVIFDTSKASQFQGPSLPWELKARDEQSTHYILTLQAKARSSITTGSITYFPQKEEEFLNTIGGRRVFQQVDAKLLRSWLQRCESDHGKGCMPSSKLPGHSYNGPTFVIDVMWSCIVDAPPESRYVALSYVWGSASVVKHVKENTKNLRTRDSLSSLRLPATIRDSMTLMHDIGERYLWVDSLCIIQNDDQMRDPEIKRMGSIYSNALFTIIAAAGDDANAGLPGVRPQSRQNLQKSLKFADCELFTVIDLRNPSNGIDHTVWAQRAWTFQERVLSNRILVFSKDQVYWSCCAATYSEERALEQVQNIDPLHLSYPQKYAAERVPWEPLELSEYCDTYDDFLSNYRQRRLSRETDLVDAFSGVSEIFAAFQQDTFLWGLPESIFSYALTWFFTGRSARNHVEVPVLDGNGSKHLVAFPSWSWAAWSGEEPSLLVLHGGDSIHVRPLLRFYIVDIEHKLVKVTERSWKDHEPDRTLWRHDDQVVPLMERPVPRAGQLCFWTMFANVRAIRRWRFQGPGQVEYILFPPPHIKPDRHSTHYPSEIVEQDFIVVAEGGYRTLILLAVEWQDGVAYRVGKTEVGKADWLGMKSREWRFITLG